MRQISITTSGRADKHTLDYLYEGMKDEFDIQISSFFPEGFPIDICVVLGDRYEAIQNAIAAIRNKTLIAHIHGGEITEGSMDEMFRHAITKLSHFHFTTTENHRERVMSMGEPPNRVFNVGSLGVERVKSLLTGAPKKDQILVTWHPNTINDQTGVETGELLEALEGFPNLEIIFWAPNIDPDFRQAQAMIENLVRYHDNARFYDDMGDDCIHEMEQSLCVVGNSSAGIIEAPSCGTPTLDIGDRQKNRASALSVVHCPAERYWIKSSLNEILKSGVVECNNPYDKPGTRDAIIEVLKTRKLTFPKRFYAT